MDRPLASPWGLERERGPVLGPGAWSQGISRGPAGAMSQGPWTMDLGLELEP
jgi:hypothetical protein